MPTIASSPSYKPLDGGQEAIPGSRLRRVRSQLSYLVIFAFLSIVLALGLYSQYDSHLGPATNDAEVSALDEVDGPNVASKPKFPDFSKYRTHVQTLDTASLPSPDSGGRVIFVGDIHGMTHPLQKLLKKLKYDKKRDRLVHVGDVVAKGGRKGSLAVLSHMSTWNISGVRGNHDQKVIEWYGYFDWIKSRPKGAAWLSQVESLSLSKFKKSPLYGSFPVPGEWEWGSEHFHIARKMSVEQYEYMLQLPLVLHLPSLHTMVVHAGLLPMDPTRKLTHPKQPFAHLPQIQGESVETVSSSSSLNSSLSTSTTALKIQATSRHFAGRYISRSKTPSIEALRTTQELALTTDVPQNKDPWVLLNMRSVSRKGRVSRGTGATDGTPWSEIWDAVVRRCKGFEVGDAVAGEETASDATVNPLDEALDASAVAKTKSVKLPCHPLTLVYGHAAGRGLDVKKWSKGLDSGCVYGRRLSALVYEPRTKNLDSTDALDDDEVHTESISFGENGRAKIVSIKCKAH